MQEHLRKITDRRTKATLEIKAFDTTVLTGVKPTGVLLDELHEIAKVAAADLLLGPAFALRDKDMEVLQNEIALHGHAPQATRRVSLMAAVSVA